MKIISKYKVIIFVLVLALFLSVYLLSSGINRTYEITVRDFLNLDHTEEMLNSAKDDFKGAISFTMNGQYEDSLISLKSAESNFDEAHQEVLSLDSIYSRKIPFSPFHTVDQIFLAAKDGVKTLEYINHILWTLTSEYNIGKALISLENVALIVDRIEDRLSVINYIFLPDDIAGQIRSISNYLGVFSVFKDFYLKHVDALYYFTGSEGAKTYAVVLQNTAEARATGGYIGSIVLFTMQGGKLSNWEILDTHLMDFEGGNFNSAPEYYSYIERIALQEANFTPDVVVSGERIMYFLEEQGGPTVDTVFFIDDYILPFLLDLVGDVKIETIDYPINSSNYYTLIQYDLEKRNILRDERVKNPKENFFLIVKEIQKKISKIKPTKEHINALLDLITSKHIQAYSRDEKIQKIFDDIGMTGFMPIFDDNKDFLAIIHSTFFNKSNRYMRDYVIHTSSIDEDGLVKNKLLIKRKHEYDVGFSREILNDLNNEDLSIVQQNDLLNVLGRGDNQDTVRIYVPLGSNLINSKGVDMIDIYEGEELNKTFFAFNMEVSSNEEKEIILEYELPFKTDEYSLFIYKQPGIDNLSMDKELIYYDNGSEIAHESIEFILEQDVSVTSNILNNLLWNTQDSKMMELKKIKLPSTLRTKTVEEYMPTPLP